MNLQYSYECRRTQFVFLHFACVEINIHACQSNYSQRHCGRPLLLKPENVNATNTITLIGFDRESAE
jgi:hypothetical protein